MNPKQKEVTAVEWTSEQNQAINTKGCNLLVAAAAGAGKTAVLVQRIINTITDEKNGVDIDRLLVVTFTNAAASEMRERIADAISKRLEEDPDSLRLSRQIVLLNKACITTIHSFCLEVIRNNFQMIDLDPTFRIADETECLLLKQEVMDELFDEKYEAKDLDRDFLELVECYGGGRGDKGLCDIVMSLYNFSQSTPFPDEWVKEAAEKFNVDDDFDFGSSIWAGVIMDSLSIELSGIYEMMKRAYAMLGGVEGLEPYLYHFKFEMDNIRGLTECNSYTELSEKLSNFQFGKLPSCRKVSDKQIQEDVKSIRDDVKKQIKKIKDEICSFTSEKIKNEMRKLYPLMKCLALLTIQFGKEYRARKKEKGIIDFNDIEHYCIDILSEKDEDGKIRPSKIALEYRKKFEEVLIDEYQDSNMVQELILSLISRKDEDVPNLFMVGDVKQSIYRFRQAEPKLFLDKYKTYKECGKERKILLYKNFRSRPEIVDGINYIFRSIMSKNIGEIRYDDSEKLNAGAKYPEMEHENEQDESVEVYIAESLKNDEEEREALDEDTTASEDEDIDSLQLEARMVAKRISDLIDSGFMVYDKNTKMYRKVEYRDIVILMRAAARPSPVYMDELSNKGIPVYADAGTGYFEVTEIQTMLSLLQIIDNPMQDIPLLSVLRSPIGAFTPDELIDIRIADDRKTYYEALKLKAASGDDGTSKRAGSFLNRLNKWRKKSVNMPISEFIWYLYTDTGYYAYAGAMPGGVQRQANLRILFERARQYEETSLKGLFNFINFINRLKKSSGDMGSAKILGENENVVRIMSIHKSKGLEFPVVFVCGLGKRFNLADLRRSILFHHDLGFGPEYVDFKKRFSYHTVIKEAIQKKMKLESYSEEMRILYVAFTRAKEKLILTGTVPDFKRAFARWGEGINSKGSGIPEYKVLKGSNFLDWICPALLKHKNSGDFRKKAGIQILPSAILDDDSKWSIKLLRKADVLKEEANFEGFVAATSDRAGMGKYYDEVNRRLSYKYPYEIASKLPAKITVTELKRMQREGMEDEYASDIFVPELIKTPLFLEGELKMSAAEKGTITHLVMQHISLDKVPTEKDVEDLMDRMIQDEFMTPEQRKGVDIRRIVKFFNSPLGIRLVESGKVWREMPFYMNVKVSDVYKDLPEGKYENEKVLVQGIIDCWFEEDDGAVLIDYKTDFVPEGKSYIIKERYGLQIDYYARALERMTNKNVKEKYIYLFHTGEIVKFDYVK